MRIKDEIIKDIFKITKYSYNNDYKIMYIEVSPKGLQDLLGCSDIRTNIGKMETVECHKLGTILDIEVYLKDDLRRDYIIHVNENKYYF